MKTGYIPVNKKSIAAPAYVEFLKTAPYMKDAFDSVVNGLLPYGDPTNRKIWDALSVAADRVLIESTPAKEAFDEATATIQEEIDRVLGK